MKQQLVNNSILNVLFSLTNGFLGFLLLPFMISKLGMIDYGLYALLAIFSSSGYAQILEFGLQSSVTKYTSQFHAKNEISKIKTLLSTVFFIFFILGCISFIVGFTFRLPLLEILNIPAEKFELTKICLIITFANFFFVLPNFALAGILQGYRLFNSLRLTEFTINILKAVIIVIILLNSLSLVFVLIAVMAMSAFQMVLYLYIVYRKCDGIYPHPRLFSWKMIYEIRTMTFWVFIGRFCSTLFKQSDRLLITMILGPAAVAAYEIFTKVPYVLKSIFGQVNEIIMPTSSFLNETEDRARKLKGLFYKAIRWQMFFSLPLYIVLIGYAAEFLAAWAGPEKAYLAEPFIMTVIMSMTLVFSGGSSMLLGINRRLKETSLLSLFAAICNVGATYIFLKYFGIIGAIYGSLVGILLQLPFVFFFFAKEFKVSIFKILKEYFSYIGFGIIALIMKQFIFNYFSIQNYLITGITGLVLIVTIYLAAYLLILDDEDRMLITQLKKRFTPG